MKISKSNFIVISVTMLTILILFQFSNLSAIYTSQAMQNKYASQTTNTVTEAQTITEESLCSQLTYTTALIGTDKQYETALGKEWCVYLKRSYNIYPTLSDFSDNISKRCKLLILSSDAVHTQKDIDHLAHIAKMGIHIIFTSLPDISFFHESNTLCRMTGVRRVKADSFRTNGITLFDGFFLGGKTSYKKIKESIPYFLLESGTKTYISGNVKNQKARKIRNEDLPAVIWRNHYENSFIFCVNFDFFTDRTGLGILTAMLSETEDYLVYPVVNAQSIICQNFPYLSNENSDRISQRYFYTSKSLYENVLWPDMVSILNATNDKFSGMIAPKTDYSDSATDSYDDSLNFYFKQTEKVSGELGLSGDQINGTSFYSNKLEYDSALFQEKAPDYTFTVFSPGSMPESAYQNYLGNQQKKTVLSDIHTLVLTKPQKTQPLLSFYSDAILAMSGTLDGFSHTNREDIYMKSLQTALGYSAVSMDFNRVLYPKGNADDWTKLSKNVSRFLDTYWKPFRKGFDQVTVSEADKKVRAFLSLSYTSYRKGDTINVAISNFSTEASFILNLTEQDIVSVSGGSFKKIENEKYLILADSPNLSIEVKAASMNKNLTD